MQFGPELIEKVLDGTKTQTRRPFKSEGQYQRGKEYAVQPGRGKKSVGRIKALSATPVYLGSISKADAKAEGFDSVEDFFDYWKKLYDGKCEPSEEVWRIEFELVD